MNLGNKSHIFDTQIEIIIRFVFCFLLSFIIQNIHIFYKLANKGHHNSNRMIRGRLATCRRSGAVDFQAFSLGDLVDVLLYAKLK